MQQKFIVLLLLMSATVLNQVSGQCTCDLPNLQSSIDSTKHIFTGYVSEKSLNTKPINKYQKKGRGIMNTFIVHHTLKGNFVKDDEVNILSGDGQKDAGFDFILGERYIVFYEKFIDSCTHTQLYNQDKELEIDSILNDSVRFVMPPPLHETRLHKHEILPLFQHFTIKACVTPMHNLDQKCNQELFEQELLKFIHEDLELYDGSLMLKVLFNRKLETENIGLFASSNEIRDKIDQVIKFIKENFMVTTPGYDCLIERTSLEVSLAY